MTDSIEVVRVWVPAFLAELRVACCVSHACDAANVSRTAAYKHRDNSPEFAAAWQEAIDGYGDDLKAEAVRRAVHGVQEVVLWQGLPVWVAELDGRIAPPDTEGATKRPLMKSRHSDAILLRLLEVALPEQFAAHARKQATSAGPTVAASVLADLRKMSDAELDARIAELERGEAAQGGGEGPGEGDEGGGPAGGEGPAAAL